jgi:ferritin-like metal-binding protein YciE
MAIKTLDEKFIHEVGDIYDAEHRFLEAQGEMHKQATDSKLKTMLQQHMKETEQQIANLEQVYELLGQKAKRVKCDAAAGLVTEGQKTMKEAADNPAILDCVIAGAAAKVEHYEIASYRGLITGAELMGQTDVLRFLRANLEQEEQTAQKVEQSTPVLLQQAMRANERGR